jgi:hypothetical protein
MCVCVCVCGEKHKKLTLFWRNFLGPKWCLRGPTSDCECPQKYPGTSKNRWHVRWLVRGGNSCGLSGGWRGFAIDQVQPIPLLAFPSGLNKRAGKASWL